MSKKRLMTGLLAGGLTMGMLPGVASAAPNLGNYGQCHKTDIVKGGWRQNGFGPLNLDVNQVERGPTLSNGKPPFLPSINCFH